MFLGDCLECCFCTTCDPVNKADTLAKEFYTKMNVDESSTSEILNSFILIRSFVMNEIPLCTENKNVSKLHSYSVDLEWPKGHSWIQADCMPNIGGDRSILHTLKLLQSFTSIINHNIGLPDAAMIEAHRGLYGPSPWRSGCTKKIHGDMDELLMADILPQWVIKIRNEEGTG